LEESDHWAWMNFSEQIAGFTEAVREEIGVPEV